MTLRRFAVLLGTCGVLLQPGLCRAAEAAAGGDAIALEGLSELDAACRRGTFDASRLPAKQEIPGSWLLGGTEAPFPLELYFACRGLSEGEASACGFFDGPGKTISSGRQRCEEARGFARAAWAALSSGQGPSSACRSYLVATGLKLPPGDGEKACGIWNEGMKSGDVKALCSRAREMGLLDEAGAKACPADLTAVEGRTQACQAISEPARRPYCVEEASLVAALRSKGKAACAASPLCGALSQGKAGPCGAYLARANQAVCRKIDGAIAQFRQVKEREASSPRAVESRKALEKAEQEEAAKAEQSRRAAAAAQASVDQAEQKTLKTQADVEEMKKLRELMRRKAQEQEAAKPQKRQYRKGEPMKFIQPAPAQPPADENDGQ